MIDKRKLLGWDEFAPWGGLGLEEKGVWGKKYEKSSEKMVLNLLALF